MPIENIRPYFEKLTTLKSKKDNKPHLTEEQLNEFIKIAFLEYDSDKNIEQTILINFKKGEIRTIRKIFYEFYSACEFHYESSKGVKDKYVRLLTDYFIGFEYKAIFDNFNK